MATSYAPVSYDFREVIAEKINQHAEGKIFFFDDEDKVDSIEGRIIGLIEIPQRGMFLTLSSDQQIRIDRIITLFGTPGVAFDEYDSFGNQCLDCTGGYPL